MHRRVAALAIATAGLLAAGCDAGSGGGSSPAASVSTPAAAGSSSATPDACAPASLKTHTSGVLTVATDTPAYEPWFVDNKPSNGKGFESAVAYAVAQQLGFPREKVKWVTAAFNSVIAPTPKNFDFDV